MILKRRVSLRPMLLIEITAVVLLLGIGITAAAIIPATNSVEDVPRPAKITYTVDDDVEITPTGIDFHATAGLAAVGDAPAGAVDMVATTYGTARTAIAQNDYTYVFDLEEQDTEALTSITATFTINVYWNDGVSDQSATLYTKNTATDVLQEGVTCTIDVGTTIPERIDIVVERTAN